MNSPDYYITNLISWKGGWASRVYFDHVVNQFLNNQTFDLSIADEIAASASGMSAIKYFDKLRKITGYQPITPVSPILTHCRSLLTLSFIQDQSDPRLSPLYWFEKLEEHTKSRNPIEVIKKALNAEQKVPAGNPINYLRSWSFPLLSKLFPLNQNSKTISFIESDLANYAWKKWFLDTDGVPIWLDNASKSNFPQSQYLVWKLIHEATHILHLTNHASAGSLYDPNWLLQMESVAMTAEYRFLCLIENGGDLNENDIFPLNKENIISVLLLGFFERALRLDEDIQVHYNGMSPDEWIAVNKHWYDDQQFHFANEFHGLPGFMAGYLIGMINYLNTPNEISLLSNQIKLSYD